MGQFSNNIIYGSATGLTYLANAGQQTLSIPSTNNIWFGLGVVPNLVAGTSNLNLNPLFVSQQNNDFHLQMTSPAKGAGLIETGLPIDTGVLTDFDGVPRAAKFSIGAYQ